MCRSCIEYNLSYAGGYAALGTTHLFRGEFVHGIEAIETALRISPNDSMLKNHLSLLSLGHYLARNYEKSAEVAKLTVLRDPKFPPGWRCLAIALGQMGSIEDASAALAQCMELVPGFTSEAVARASLGFRDEVLFQHWLEGLRKAGWQG